MTTRIRSRRHLLVVVGALAALVPDMPAAAHHVSEGDVRFKAVCNFTHSLPDDPIVHPNQPGASHVHDFLGREGVNAGTTSFAQLVDGDDATSCDDAADLSSYWAPALYADGVKVNPERMGAYYRRGSKHGSIEPYPDGLKIVSDENGWQCGEKVAEPTTCPSDLKLRVDFPDCWDGVNLDSANHRSHMAASVPTSGRQSYNVCPASHPVQVPRLTMYVNYKLARRASSVVLASGPAAGAGEQAHADFFNGWERDRLVERIDTCLNQLQRCEAGG